MRGVDFKGIILFVVFLIVGGILGGILGDVFAGMPMLDSILPILSHHYEIFNIQHVNMNLYIMEIQFGIHVAPNILSILGVVLAWFIFRHVR